MSEKVVNKVAFGKTIKAARERLNYTQYALADTIDVSQNFLGDIERGVKLPSIETLIKLSNVLKVSLDSMFASSLDNYLAEEDIPVYTDKQVKILTNIVKNVRDNF